MSQTPAQLEIALDIGHSSIGWAVFQNAKSFDLLGTGVVLFPADDCLAVKRRDHRRQRRHVRATRQRIERLKRLLLHLGVLTETELSKPGCAWPWKLAAEVLGGAGRRLSWPELWDVLRWYAHNRGYDGNARWNKQEDTEDTEKVENANSLMKQHGTETMAETFCAVLEVKPGEAKRASRVRFKGLNVAFPRETVQSEARLILEAHIGKLKQVTPQLVRAIVGNDGEWDDGAWSSDIEVPTVKLPKRYKGSYLFGQSVPRFDNRIISSCPITYQRVLAATGDPKRAVRDSKVPAKKCREFLLFRWAMILANLTVNDGRATRRLTPEERKAIHQVMVQGDPDKKIKTRHPIKAGHLTKVQLRDTVFWATAIVQNNVESYFLTANAEEALRLRPERLPSGRAPYARKVMKEAVREIFSSDKHPAEEGGCLYRSEAVRNAQLQRSLEEKTSNHLVRHRVLIARRLVADVVKSYAAGKKESIEKVTIEVNRDLQAFSGMTNKEIEGELTQMLKDHGGVVKRLEKDFAEAGKKYRITPGLIRKARIAQDMDWTCPYTSRRFDAIELATGAFDKDHIIPRSVRPSDSLESLVITSKAVNAMKGNRTALQFVQEFEGQDIPGERAIGKQKPTLITVAGFRKLVDGLETKGLHRQDIERKKKRKALLLLDRYEEKGFLPKDLTQTSHLVRLAAAEMEKEFEGVEKKPRIVSLPGSVTGEIRKGWKLYGCLAAHNPEVAKLLEREKTEEINIKKELRDITHQHHALDACVIGFTSHFLPNDGGLWEALVKRNRKPQETDMLLARRIFSRDSEGRARLAPLRDELKQQITERLGECRVVQHIPKRMGGLAGLEENTRGIVAIEVPDSEVSAGKKTKGKLKEIWNNKSKQPLPDLKDIHDAVVHLQQYGPRDPKKNDKRERKPTQERAGKLLGLQPENGKGKLRAIKGVRVVTANFGLALWRKDARSDGEMQMRIILGHKVWPQLRAIADKENGGKWPEVLRNGQLVRVPKGRYEGVWQIASIKNNTSGMAVDMMRPEMTKLKNGVEWAKINVNLKTLIADGMAKLPHALTGCAA